LRLDLLLVREPFEKKFLHTLETYLSEQLGWKGAIHWKRGYSLNQSALLVSSKLNLIYSREVSIGELRQLASEYAYHINPIRRLLQGLFVKYTISKPFRWLFSDAYVLIEPMPEACKSWCILPGNHSIRIVDVSNNECIVLRKEGANKNYIRSLLELRKAHPSLPGPTLYRTDQSLDWYAEERIYGLPVNRDSDKNHVKSAMSLAQESMLRLYEGSIKKITVDEWVNRTVVQLEEAVLNLPGIYPASVREEVLRVAKGFSSIIMNGLGVDSFETVISHGDFQPANLLIPNDRSLGAVYLIDWEYTARRCRWYDALVFVLHSRSPKGLAFRVRQFLSDDQTSYQSIAWCGIARSSFNLRFVVASFLLEDLLVRLSDTTISGLLKPVDGFLIFLNELSSIESNLLL